MSNLVRFLLVCLMGGLSIGYAAVPQQISYQGRLTQNGATVPDSTYELIFSIYSAASGGNPLWTSGSQSVVVKGGLFSYNLGVSTLLPPSLFSSDTLRWLGIKVGAGAEMTPRTRLVSTAFAYKAQVADTATYALNSPSAPNGWTDAGTKVLLTTLTDTLGIGISNPSAKVHVMTEATEAKLGGTEGVYGKHTATYNYGNLGSATSGALGIAAGAFTGMRGVTQTGRGVWGTATLAAGYGVWGEHQSNGYFGYLGGDTFGVYGLGVTGVKGVTQLGNGVWGTATMAAGHGVWGDNQASGYAGFLGGLEVGVFGSAAPPGRAGHFDGDVYISKHLGLGVMNPATALEIRDMTATVTLSTLSSVGMYKIKRDTTSRWALSMDDYYNYFSLYEYGSAAHRLTVRGGSGNVGIGLTDPVRKLQVRETVAGLSLPLKVENHGGTLTTSVGIQFSAGGSGPDRGKGAIVYEANETWNRGKFHILQDAGIDTTNPTLADAVVTVANNGNVGIGDTNPQAKLVVNGDLIVNGALRGNNGTSGGAPFPRPAYNSGWIELLPGSSVTLWHYLGGDPYNYLVVLDQRASQSPNLMNGIAAGGDFHGSFDLGYGSWWEALTNENIKIHRTDADVTARYLRVRIWVIE